jgi:hypothetical protein
MHNADNKEAQSPEFPDDALVIFIGYSDDAIEEAQAVLSLQPKLERRFRDYLALKDGDSGFLVANEWARGVEMP